MNRDAAFDFALKAKSALKDNDLDKALKYYNKSYNLFPTDEIKNIINNLEKQKLSSANSHNTHASKNHNIPEKTKPPPTPIPERAFTSDQSDFVKSINKTKNLYELLGVPKESDTSTITSAYRKLAVKLHPDKNSAPGADEAFKKVKSAYEVLSDDERRKRYDSYGEEDEQPQQPSFRRHYAGEPELTPEDIFSAFFFGGHPGMRRGQNEHPFFSQFARASARQRQQQNNQEREPRQQSPQGLSNYIFLLPFLLIFLMSYINQPATQDPFSLNRNSTFSVQRNTKTSQFPYYVTPNFHHVYGRDSRSVYQVDAMVESQVLKNAEAACENEKTESKKIRAEARKMRGNEQVEMMKKADNMPNCDKIKNFYAQSG